LKKLLQADSGRGSADPSWASPLRRRRRCATAFAAVPDGRVEPLRGSHPRPPKAL